jgi:hypothetical protein
MVPPFSSAMGGTIHSGMKSLTEYFGIYFSVNLYLEIDQRRP